LAAAFTGAFAAGFFFAGAAAGAAFFALGLALPAAGLLFATAIQMIS
jgi:hypothetical protein